MKKNTKNTVLVDALVWNNRFANRAINAEQILSEELSVWKSHIDVLHRASYKAYVLCENSGLKAESNAIDKTEVFNAIRAILAYIGDVNEHKLYANAEMAVAMIAYSGKRGNIDAPELQFCCSRISSLKKEIAQYEKLNVSNAEHKLAQLEKMQATLATLKDEKRELLATADMRIKQPTRTSANAFRLDVEHFLARTISGQLAKTLEELDAEEAERKEQRKAAAKARKANRKEKNA